MSVFISSTTFVRIISHSKKNWARYDKKNLVVFIWNIRYSDTILMKLNLNSFSKNV